MKTRPLGTSGIEASVVALGTWAMGGWMWGGTDEKHAIAAIHAALDEGMNLLDTAPMYGFGLSEEIVGKAIKGRRHDAILATKCGMRWDDDGGEFFFRSDAHGRNPEGEFRVYRNLRPDSIRHELEQSLRRLGTDYIDLYQTHWQDPTTPIEDSMGELLKLRDEGKVRAIGVCNASPEQMEAYRKVGPLDCDQERFSMLDRKLEFTNVEYCQRNGVAFLAYSPLANGLLTGTVTPDRTFGAGDLRGQQPRFSVANRLRVAALLDEIQPIATRHNATLSQLAIAWAIAQPGVTHALVGGRNPRQVSENLLAAEFTLTDEDLRVIAGALGKHAGGIV